MVCIDYSSHPVTLGELSRISIDFGENLTLGVKLRKALSEGEKTERNQCVALRRAAAYEWVSQGCPRRPLRSHGYSLWGRSCVRQSSSRHPNVWRYRAKRYLYEI